MDEKGDIPSRESIEPPGELSELAKGKVETLKAALDGGGTIHSYLISGDGENDEHFHYFNTHCFPETGWVYKHGDDLDQWIPGDDLGKLERHYE